MWVAIQGEIDGDKFLESLPFGVAKELYSEFYPDRDNRIVRFESSSRTVIVLDQDFGKGSMSFINGRNLESFDFRYLYQKLFGENDFKETYNGTVVQIGYGITTEKERKLGVLLGHYEMDKFKISFTNHFISRRDINEDELLSWDSKKVSSFYRNSG